MSRRHVSGLLALAFVAAACSDNPVSVEDDGHDDTLTAQLTLSDDHVHTLSELTFSVVVYDHHDEVVTDLEMVTVDRLSEGSETWRSTELTRTGTVWSGPYIFNSSGDYQLRVSVMRHDATEPEVIYTMAEHLHVGRAHVVVGDYRVEFESFPGHIHQGDAAEMMFWVFQAEKNADGIRPPVEGLAPRIECIESTGASEEHEATEVEQGVYMATHTFGEAGAFTAKLRLIAGEVEFETNVAKKH